MKTLRGRLKVFAAGLLLLWILDGVLALLVLPHTAFAEGTAFFIFHFGAAALLSVVFWRWVCCPFRKTEKAMDDFGKGYVDQSVLQSQLPVSEGYLEMIRQFDSVVDRKKLLELSVEQSRLIALQNQMNPHFLYNTLDAIRGDALRAGMTEMAQTMESLSLFLSYSISELDKYATIGEEICNVRDYFQVQQYRFGQKLKLHVDLSDADPEVNDYYITRMTLQPLVENAICHGLERKASMGTVTVKVIQTEKKVLLLVSDDGVGMTQAETDRLNRLLHSPGVLMAGQKRKGGIALNNVNARMKLLFGDEYGLTVFAQQGIGCTVQVKCPVLTRNIYEKRTSEH